MAEEKKEAQYTIDSAGYRVIYPRDVPNSSVQLRRYLNTFYRRGRNGNDKLAWETQRLQIPHNGAVNQFGAINPPINHTIRVNDVRGFSISASLESLSSMFESSVIYYVVNGDPMDNDFMVVRNYVPDEHHHLLTSKYAHPLIDDWVNQCKVRDTMKARDGTDENADAIWKPWMVSKRKGKKAIEVFALDSNLFKSKGTNYFAALMNNSGKNKSIEIHSASAEDLAKKVLNFDECFIAELLESGVHLRMVKISKNDSIQKQLSDTLHNCLSQIFESMQPKNSDVSKDRLLSMAEVLNDFLDNKQWIIYDEFYTNPICVKLIGFLWMSIRYDTSKEEDKYDQSHPDKADNFNVYETQIWKENKVLFDFLDGIQEKCVPFPKMEGIYEEMAEIARVTSFRLISS